MTSMVKLNPEITRLLREDDVMPNSRIRSLLNELQKEMKGGGFQKNIKVETLIRKLKSEGLSEREKEIFKLHIVPVFCGLTLNQAMQKVRPYVEKVASEKVKSTAKKELRLFARLMKLGDPTFELPKVKFKKPGNKFTVNQVLELDQILPVIRKDVFPDYRLPCEVALYSGMRRGNVLGLRRKDVDLKRRELRFTLNKSERDMLVPICGKLAEVFSRVPWPVEPDGLLFPGIVAKAMSIQVSRAFTRAGYPWFSFHKLRHTAACFLLDNDVPITTVSALLGHSSIKVTMDFYARVRPGKLAEAVKKFDVL